MKRNLFITAIILTISTFAILQSCEKKAMIDIKKTEVSEELTFADMPELEVKNGMLYFDNEDEFLKTVSIIPNLNEEELDEWESNLGFISVRTKQNEFYIKLESFNEETISDDDIRNLVEEYKDYFEIVKDEKGEEEICALINDIVYSSITNKNLLYQTSIGINKVFSDKLFFSENLDINEMLFINSESNNPNIEVLYYKPNNNKTVALTATITKDLSGCVDDRRASITLETYMYLFSYYPQVQFAWDVVVTVRGYDKFLCTWYNYKTALSYKEVKGVIKVGYDDITFSIPDKSEPSDVRSISARKTYIRTTGQGYEGFVKAYGKGSSRGVGNLWAIINNGY